MMNHIVTVGPGIESYRLLQGYRGNLATDIPALREILLRLSRLMDAIPEIRELDLNPIFALSEEHGCRIVDARIPIETGRVTIAV